MSPKPELPPVAAVESQLHWIAGYFEAKGYTTIQRNTSSFCILVSVNFRHRSEFEDNFVRPLREASKLSIGSTTPSRTAIKWYATGRKAGAFLALLLPYMRIPERRREVGILLQLQNLISHRGKPRFVAIGDDEAAQREALYGEFCALKAAQSLPSTEDLDRAGEILANAAHLDWGEAQAKIRRVRRAEKRIAEKVA